MRKRRIDSPFKNKLVNVDLQGTVFTGTDLWKTDKKDSNMQHLSTQHGMQVFVPNQGFKRTGMTFGNQ